MSQSEPRSLKRIRLALLGSFATVSLTLGGVTPGYAGCDSSAGDSTMVMVVDLESCPPDDRYLRVETDPADDVEPEAAMAVARVAAEPSAFVHRQVDGAPAGTGLPCLKTDQNCGRVPWWAQRSTNQSAEFVQYRFIGPGLVTEARFIEAVWLLWSWPEGEGLLRSGADHGVTVNAGASERFSDAFGHYVPPLAQIEIGTDFARGPNWLVAAVLAHELQHAEDHLWRASQRRTYEDCITREQRAYEAEARFVAWLSNRFGSLPALSTAQAQFSKSDYALFLNISAIARSNELRALVLLDYEHRCR